MIPDRWTDRLSEHLDGGLDASEKEALEAHLAECAECAAAIRELHRVRERARSLVDAPPERDLWPGIESRIRRTEPLPLPGRREPFATGRRFTFTLPQLAAAGFALAIVSAGAALWIGRGTDRRAPVPARGVASSRAPAVGAVIAADSGARSPHSEYETAIAELRRALASGRGTLDSATVRTLESNLAIIELAIGQARRALASDPANPYVRDHLAETMRRKVELLKRATTLASAG